jgi:peptidoglycan/xylan/chitin deacetylase (PgdA/CDA1 family)
VFDKKNRQEREACYKNTLSIVPRMLEMFSEHGVHVTWATVGSMFANNREEWEELKPAIEPDYTMQQYSPYKWVRQHGMEDEYKWAHFAPDMVAKIMEFPGQELATHTFSHYYCLEEQFEKNAFDADLKAANRAAEKFGAKMISLVFPRNQFNPEYLKTCIDNNIWVVRSNPSNWFWSPVQNKGSNLTRKIARTLDAYIQVGSERTSYPLSSIEIKDNEPLQLPASRFLRPWRNQYQFANGMRLRRLCSEMKEAAIRKECFHLWWHPENFGDHPEENLKGLKVLLNQFVKLKEKYGMESWNMGEYAQNLIPHKLIQTKPKLQESILVS